VLKNNIKNILAVRNDRFGEFLLNIPAFRSLKAGYPGARLTLVVNPAVYELAKCIEGVDEIIVWENRKHRLGEILKFIREIKSKKPGFCIIFNPSKEFNIISFLSGIPVRIGYDRKWGFLLTHKIKDRKYLGQKHEVEYNLELAKLSGVDVKGIGLSLKINDNIINGLIRDYGLADDSDLIALHPYTSDTIKQWPMDNFRALAKKISLEIKQKVIIVGGKEEASKYAGSFSGLNGVVDMTGKTTLVQLAALLKRCRLLISGDSGPVHLASAVGTPVVAIFRNDIPGKSPKRWGPWGRNNIVIEKSDLLNITVEEVMGKVRCVITVCS